MVCTTPKLPPRMNNCPFRCELVPGQTYYVNLTLGGNQGPGPYCPRELEYCILELGQSLN